MRTTILAALLLGATSLGSAQAAVINLSATDFSQSSYTQSFGPGSYIVSLVSDLYSAWAPATPSAGNWTDYYKYTINGTDSYFYPLGGARYATAADAFAAYSTVPQLRLDFATTTDVKFAIADSQGSFGDNAGGVSLSIAAVPETATWAMMVVGFGAIGFAMRSRQRTTGVAFG